MAGPPIPMSSFRTPFMGYAVEFSPFDPNLLAVATSQHYGVIGNGRQHVLSLASEFNKIEHVAAFDSQDGLFDCAWSENSESHLLSASGDGSVKLWELRSNMNPLRSYNEHKAEVYSVDWNPVSKELFVSGSWDNTIKVWHPSRMQSLNTFAEHQSCIYTTRWSPLHESTLASTSGDCTLKIWDCKSVHFRVFIGFKIYWGPEVDRCSDIFGYTAPRSVMTIGAHNNEVLSCDWCKYNENIIVTGSVDRSIRVWDIRTQRVLHTLIGHEYAVRRVKCSPHYESVIASASYDMSLRIWDFATESLITRFDHHSEFVLGVDFSLFNERQIASCSWDELVCVMRY